MGKPQKTELLNQLLQQKPAQVEAWLQNVRSGQENMPEGFNWLGLAESAAFNARSEADLTWAKVAISIYEELANRSNDSDRHSFMLSSLNLRAYMVARLGVIPGDAILDSDKIIHYFLSTLKFPYEWVEKKVSNWTRLELEDIKELRRIKNYLGVIRFLMESGKHDCNPKLKNWLSLQEKLP
jgi:hypothetical protein